MNTKLFWAITIISILIISVVGAQRQQSQDIADALVDYDKGQKLWGKKCYVDKVESICDVDGFGTDDVQSGVVKCSTSATTSINRAIKEADFVNCGIVRAGPVVELPVEVLP